MINKLSQRIFLLIIISLSIVIIGIIVTFAILNYNNTINTATSMMERFAQKDIKRNSGDRKDIPLRPDIEINGVYYVLVENLEVVQNFSVAGNKEIEEYAIKIAKKNKDKGIIGKYIYKTRKIRDNAVDVQFIEDEDTILHIRAVLVLSLILIIGAIIMNYIIAKKLSKIIVKPVEETFEKQKQFISDASHELKTPLAVIEANADVLENELSKNKWIGYIQNEVESMDKLINELLLLTKIENIDILREHEQFNISETIEIVLSMFESMAYEKEIKIKSSIQEQVLLNGNKEGIEHIVSILLDNAIKHTMAKSEVIVELIKEKSEIVLRVSNRGEPIPEEEREKIFERFYRVDKSRNRKEKRYGLGLAIAKSIVQKYGGKISNSYKDGFTVFEVIIPI